MKTDVTDRSKVRPYLDSVGVNTSDVVFVTNTLGVILSENPAAEALGGNLGKAVFEIVETSSSKQFMNWFRDVLSGGTSTPIETTLRGDNGYERSYEFIAATARDQEGGPVLQLIGRDVSKRLASENLLVKGKQVAELLGSLNTNVIRILGHELKTPLNGIIGCAEVLTQDSTTDSQRELLGHILTSGERLDGTLSDLMDYASVSGGEWIFADQEFDITQMLDRVREDCSPLAKAKAINFNVQIGSRIPKYLKGDLNNVSQVVTTLIKNAIKFTEQGSVCCRVSKMCEGDGSEILIVFEIIDTGVGIEEGAMDWVLEPFKQAASGASRRYDGLGIGLSICKLITDQMGGSLGFESSVGEGTRFWLKKVFRNVSCLNEDSTH